MLNKKRHKSNKKLTELCEKVDFRTLDCLLFVLPPAEQKAVGVLSNLITGLVVCVTFRPLTWAMKTSNTENAILGGGGE